MKQRVLTSMYHHNNRWRHVSHNQFGLMGTYLLHLTQIFQRKRQKLLISIFACHLPTDEYLFLEKEAAKSTFKKAFNSSIA